MTEPMQQSRPVTPSPRHPVTRSPRHIVILSVAVWSLILLAISTRVLIAQKPSSVYPLFASAARRWLDGADLYRAAGDPYRYSPLVTAGLVPFSLLPDRLGGVLWRWLNAAVYLGAFGWWARVVLTGPVRRGQLAILFLLLVPLSVGSLNNGQSNLLVIGLLLAGVAAVAGERWNLASVCVALACLFKLYPVAVGLLLALVYPRRFAGRFAVALVLGLAVPFLLQRPGYVAEQYVGWLEHLRRDDRTVLPLALWYRDLRLLCHVWGMPLSVVGYLSVQLAAAAAIAGLCLAGRLASWPQSRLLTCLLNLGCIWMTLFGAATESSTYSLLAPTLAATVLLAWQAPQPAWLRGVVSASLVLFIATQAAAWFPDGARRFHALAIHPLAALLLLVGLLAVEWRRSFAAVPSEEEMLPGQPARAA
jgi:hypothetical protein